MRQLMNTITIDFCYKLGENPPSEEACVGASFTDTDGKEIEQRRFHSCTRDLIGGCAHPNLPSTKAELIKETLEAVRRFMEEAFRGEHEGTGAHDDDEFAC